MPSPVASARHMADEDLAAFEPVTFGAVRRWVGHPNAGGCLHEVTDGWHGVSLDRYSDSEFVW